MGLFKPSQSTLGVSSQELVTLEWKPGMLAHFDFEILWFHFFPVINSVAFQYNLDERLANSACPLLFQTDLGPYRIRQTFFIVADCGNHERSTRNG